MNLQNKLECLSLDQLTKLKIFSLDDALPYFGRVAMMKKKKVENIDTSLMGIAAVNAIWRY
jgi:hypothetical protein